MRDIFTLFLHAIVVVIRLVRHGGLRSVVAESVLMRHQVLILNRGRKRAPNPSGLGSNHCGFVYLAHASRACFAVGGRLKDLDSTAFSQDADPAKVPSAVFPQTRPSARSQRPHERTDRRSP